MEPTTKQVKCITRKGQFVPKKIKKGIHCRSKPGGANASVPGSSGGGFSSGASASADTAIAMNTGKIFYKIQNSERIRNKSIFSFFVKYNIRQTTHIVQNMVPSIFWLFDFFNSKKQKFIF